MQKRISVSLRVLFESLLGHCALFVGPMMHLECCADRDNAWIIRCRCDRGSSSRSTQPTGLLEQFLVRVIVSDLCSANYGGCEAAVMGSSGTDCGR